VSNAVLRCVGLSTYILLWYITLENLFKFSIANEERQRVDDDFPLNDAVDEETG